MTYTLGAVPSPPDPRDYPIANFIAQAGAPPALPAVWDFTSCLQPVRNQGGEGTCVGHALTAVMGYQQNVLAEPGKVPDREVLSPRDAYEGARMLEPVNGDGATPRSALKWAQRQGICREDLWPYTPGTRGTPSGQTSASRYANRVITYARVPLTPAAVRAALYWHGPVLAVINADAGFQATGKDGWCRSSGPAAGQHAIAISGWDDSRQAFRIRNSWGTNWGAGGDAWLPYSWYLTEAWSCTPALGAPPPEVSWLERIFPALFL